VSHPVLTISSLAGRVWASTLNKSCPGIWRDFDAAGRERGAVSCSLREKHVALACISMQSVHPEQKIRPLPGFEPRTTPSLRCVQQP